MSLPDPKAIKKLADTCRKAGITHFKSPDFEFTLGEQPQPKGGQKVRKGQPKGGQIADSDFKSDSLTEQELLFWSTGITSSEEAAS